MDACVVSQAMNGPLPGPGGDLNHGLYGLSPSPVASAAAGGEVGAGRAIVLICAPLHDVDSLLSEDRTTGVGPPFYRFLLSRISSDVAVVAGAAATGRRRGVEAGICSQNHVESA